MKSMINRALLAALAIGGAGALCSFAADSFTVTFVDPDHNLPVANQPIHIHESGQQDLMVRTNEKGEATLPSSFKGKTAVIRCSGVPLLFDTKEVVDSGITVVMKHKCS